MGGWEGLATQMLIMTIIILTTCLHFFIYLTCIVSARIISSFASLLSPHSLTANTILTFQFRLVSLLSKPPPDSQRCLLLLLDVKPSIHYVYFLSLANRKTWGRCNSVVEHLPSMHEALGSNLRATKGTKRREYPCCIHDGGARAQRATIRTLERRQWCLNCELVANEETD